MMSSCLECNQQEELQYESHEILVALTNKLETRQTIFFPLTEDQEGKGWTMPSHLSFYPPPLPFLLNFFSSPHSYKGPLKEESVFRDAVKQGLNSENYTQLLHSLCGELKTSLSLQETVSLPQGSTEDHEAFQLELRGFLAELKCPHADLTTDVCLLSSYKKRLLVLEYLESELIACRLTLLRQSRDQAMETSDHEVCAH